jgi:methyl coenzyme M reductase gamma subunit
MEIVEVKEEKWVSVARRQLRVRMGHPKMCGMAHRATHGYEIPVLAQG